MKDSVSPSATSPTRSLSSPPTTSQSQSRPIPRPTCPFQWRDPLYKDKNTDAEEYDDYHVMQGFPTPFTISRYKNDDEVRQYYLVHVKYNQELPPDFWSVDATEKKIKR